MHSSASSFPLCTALRASLRGYNAATFRADVMAAFVVALVALPLSMALSIAVGLPPQHGLYTAIAAGILTPLLGGARLQVSGPTAAFVVILAPIVEHYGLRGIIWCTILAGGILLGMGLSRMGRLINYVPYPVTTGFTAGIAVVLATLSLNDLFGLGLHLPVEGFIAKFTAIATHMDQLRPHELAVGLTMIFFLFYAPRVTTVVPSAIIALLFATTLSFLLARYGYPVETLASRFSYLTPEGVMRAGIPPYPPLLHIPGFSTDPLFALPDAGELRLWLFPALTIAILAALESLLSATVADSMAGTRHDPNAELNAIGMGNIMAALVAGIPATGAIARTATMINAGGKTPLASSLHALMVLAFMMVLAPFINYIPMSALAGLLIYTAYRMSHWRQFMRTLRIAPGSDRVVLLACFLLTVFVDMVAGVGVGMVAASFLLMKRVADATHVEMEISARGVDTPSLLQKAPEGTLIYRIRGPLFFGTIEKALDRTLFNPERLKCLILDLSHVPFIDMTGLVALKSLFAAIATPERQVYLVGAAPEVREKIEQKMVGHPVGEHIGFCPTVADALAAEKLAR